MIAKNQSAPKKILFVCVENSARSQMAEAFARLHGKDKIEAYSAGSQPSGQVHPEAIASMRDRGYDLTQHRSLSEIPKTEYAAIVTMGCGDACPAAEAKRREEWNIPDPKVMSPEEFRKVRDLIEKKVKALIEEELSGA